MRFRKTKDKVFANFSLDALLLITISNILTLGELRAEIVS
jgi:hypothetical protein